MVAVVVGVVVAVVVGVAVVVAVVVGVAVVVAVAVGVAVAVAVVVVVAVGMIHVIPLVDLRDHDASAECWCRPTPDEDEPSVLVHHAMDGREEYEEGTRLPT